MKKRLLLTVWLLCGLTMLSWGQTDGKKEAKLLVDGCFFTESPSELQGAAYQMSILKNDEGRIMLLVTGIKLSEESKKYAIPLSEVKDADYWLEKAKENKKFLSIIDHAPKSALKEGERIKPFSVQATDGSRWTDSNTQGRPLVLNFWYTGCGPCIREMPELNGWMDVCPDVNYLAVTWNTPEQIEKIIERRGFRFHQVAGDSVLWKMFGVQQTPTTVVLDKQGVVRKLVTGTSQQKRDELLEAIRQVSDEKQR